jgi:hypothetical protein
LPLLLKMLMLIIIFFASAIKEEKYEYLAKAVGEV